MTAVIIPIAPPNTGRYWPLQYNADVEPTTERINTTLAHIAGKHPTGRVFVVRLAVGGWFVWFELTQEERNG